jgi:hypothetical protein
MKWPEIPESLGGLTAAEIRTLAAQIARALADSPVKMTEEEQVEWEEYRQLAINLQARANMLAETETPEPPVVEEADEDLSADDDSDEELTEDDVDDADEEDLSADAPVNTTLSVATTRQVVSVSSQWRATGAVPGIDKNSGFDSNRDLAEAVLDAASAMSSGASSRVEVAKMSANFGDRTDYIVPDDPMQALAFFDALLDGGSEAIEAACCAPFTPLYDLACENTNRRPVANSLPTFQTPTRNGFSVMPSPSLSDITTGYGQWTCADDDDSEAIKSACQTITCGSPTDYEIYGVYACLTVKNLVNMGFPELVAAYLNRLQARRARLAETLLLEAMGTGATTIDGFAQGYGANTSLMRNLMTYLGLYQDVERWDVDMMECWAPRWLMYALRMDAGSRRRTDGGAPRFPTQAEIEATFRDAGFNVHWYIDRPSWATAFEDRLVGTGALNFFPSTVELLVARPGKFARMDRGDLTVGVSPNNIYRKEDDLMRNQFTFFFESFEGLIDTDSCPAHLIEIPNLCYNGAQISDVAIDCEGEAGVIGS